MARVSLYHGEHVTLKIQELKMRVVLERVRLMNVIVGNNAIKRADMLVTRWDVVTSCLRHFPWTPRRA